MKFQAVHFVWLCSLYYHQLTMDAGYSIGILMVGKLNPGIDDVNLDASNMASMYSNVSGLSIGLGLASALGKHPFFIVSIKPNGLALAINY